MFQALTVGAGGSAPAQVCDTAYTGPAAGATPTATPPPSDGNSGGNTATDTSGGAGGPSTGVGALAPAVGSIPTWAAIMSALGGGGLLGIAGSAINSILRRRRR